MLAMVGLGKQGTHEDEFQMVKEAHACTAQLQETCSKGLGDNDNNYSR